MARIGLCIYLVVATVAGPAICPCSVQQFFASTIASNPDAALNVASTCCCCRKVPTTGPNAPPADDRSDPVQPPCSCPFEGHGVVAMLPPRVQQIDSTLSNILNAAYFDALLLCAVCALPRVQFAAACLGLFPCLLPLDRLHVLCVLRC
jgi:hypothetical protein